MAEDRSALAIARSVTAAFNRITTLTNELRQARIEIKDLKNRVEALESKNSEES
jgi:uncharacterized protein YydD (DUF2326 family)